MFFYRQDYPRAAFTDHFAEFIKLIERQIGYLLSVGRGGGGGGGGVRERSGGDRACEREREREREIGALRTTDVSFVENYKNKHVA